jgi:hypothetical protein
VTQRAPRAWRPRVESVARLPLRVLEDERRELARLELEEPVDVERPRTRAECVDGPRPCPWVSCRYHLALDVSPRTGSIKVTHPGREPWELAATCALDVAAEHPEGLALEDVAQRMNLTRERVRQIEAATLAKLSRSGRAHELAGDAPASRVRLRVVR